MKKLNRKNTGLLVDFPVKVIQIGEGNFIRGFADYLIDKLNADTGFNAGVAMVQPRSGGKIAKLKEQDGLFSVFSRGIENSENVDNFTIVSCVTKTIDPYIEYEDFLALARTKELEFFLSNTTEAGIAFNKEDIFKNAPHKSFPAKATAFLLERFRYFEGDPSSGLTFLPLELIPRNAERLKEEILRYADFWELPEDFRKWVMNHNLFYNTLVDRIVPGYPANDIEHFEERLGYQDNYLVTAEPYLFWAIETRENLNDRIPFDKISSNIVTVPDLEPYQKRKVRILNGMHTGMTAFSYLYGNRTVGQTFEDEFTGNFMRKTVFEEIIPGLELPEGEMKEYAEVIIERFQNPFLNHKLMDIALNSTSKIKQRLLPTIFLYQERYENLPLRLVYLFSCIIRLYDGIWKGQKIPVQDDPKVVSSLGEIWQLQSYAEIAEKVLQQSNIWGSDLNEIPNFKSAVALALENVERSGVEEGFRNYISSAKA